jgi:5-methylcytosine-specific restriction endonuclease McrA
MRLPPYAVVRGAKMRRKKYTVRSKAGIKWKESGKSTEEIVKELQDNLPKNDYREQSLRIHGLICAKCAREFDHKDRHLLTVHHKDGNHRNNPPDGSNWENLCVYCHDDEHSRGLLGDYLSNGK